MTTDAELVCGQCGNPTVEPAVWQSVRPAFVAPPTPTPEPEAPLDQKERWIKIGLGGMAAFLLFLVVYLIAYLTYML
jgi:hypothetical protein